MAARVMDALAPALSAALAGGAALALDASAAVVLGAAVLGAAGGGSLRLGLRRAGGTERPARSTAAGPYDDMREHVQDLLDALPVAVLVIARDRRVRLANRGAREMFRLPATGHSAAVLRAPRLLDAIDAGYRTGKAATVEFPLPRVDASHLRAHLRLLGNGDTVVAVEDRTDARLATTLHRDFVADASHELKTPLAALSGLLETLLGAARDDPAASERFLRLLAAQVERMTQLVEDLLSLNRIEQNERVHPREPLDLAAVVTETVEALRPAAEAARVALRLELPEGDGPLVPGDRGELAQLVRNLVENAISYGGAGAEVRVLLSDAPGHPGMVGLAVRDTGPGIAPEHIPRLTERFYRVSPSRSREKGGTGLGLAIVKHIVTRHRGRLEIESSPGEGSSFTVWLPRVETGAEAPMEARN